MNETTTIINGYPIHEVNVTLNVNETPYVPRWNLIGWFKQQDTNASGLAKEILYCSAVSVWDPINSTYISHIVGVNESPNPVIKRGMGVAVWTNKDSYWHAIDIWRC